MVGAKKNKPTSRTHEFMEVILKATETTRTRLKVLLAGFNYIFNGVMSP